MSRSLLWKIFIAVAASGVTFTATTLTEQEVTWALMLSAFVGGVTLVVQPARWAAGHRAWPSPKYRT